MLVNQPTDCVNDHIHRQWSGQRMNFLYTCRATEIFDVRCVEATLQTHARRVTRLDEYLCAA